MHIQTDAKWHVWCESFDTHPFEAAFKKHYPTHDDFMSRLCFHTDDEGEPLRIDAYVDHVDAVADMLAAAKENKCLGYGVGVSIGTAVPSSPVSVTAGIWNTNAGEFGGRCNVRLEPCADAKVLEYRIRRATSVLNGGAA